MAGINEPVGQIEYKRGYKYQLAETYSVDVFIAAKGKWSNLYLRLDKTNGILQIERGYAWDGPSGPTVDTKTFMRASLVHDALYQMIRLGVLDKSLREHADKLMRVHCRDGMSKVRSQCRRFTRWHEDKSTPTSKCNQC